MMYNNSQPKFDEVYEEILGYDTLKKLITNTKEMIKILYAKAETFDVLKTLKSMYNIKEISSDGGEYTVLIKGYGENKGSSVKVTLTNTDQLNVCQVLVDNIHGEKDSRLAKDIISTVDKIYGSY